MGLKVLVACEFSGVVTKAFRDRGHEAYSCDILDSEYDNRYHYKLPLEIILKSNRCKDFDLLIAFPPCTHLCVSGARWFKDKIPEQNKALEFVKMILNAPINKIAMENPIGIISTRIRKPDQIVQPWMFGHGETKATCLWLKNLPKLKPTNVVEGREARIHKMTPSADRGRLRSITYKGIAEAMAEQWVS